MRMFYGGAEIPGHRQLLADQGIEHVSLSYMGLRRRIKFVKPWTLDDQFDLARQRVLVDSGCHTLNREGVEVTTDEIQDIAEHYDRLIADNLEHLTAFTEFDALTMGKDWIEERRRHLDPEKSIVVWHAEWGLDELRRMAGEYPYIAVGQTTAADRDIVPVLRQLSREVRLHGMGFSSPTLMLAANWHSVASTTWLSAAQHGETFVWAGSELKRYPARYKEQARKRHRTIFQDAGFDADKIEADDPTEVLKLSLWSWEHQIRAISQRHGEAVTPTPEATTSENGETGAQVVHLFPPNTENEGATLLPAERVKRLLPGIEQEPFVHRYTDPDTGERTSREEHRLNVVDLNVRACDGCFLARKCPEYKAGHQCAYEIPVRVRTKEQYLALLDNLIAMQTERVLFMRLVEATEGGYADPNLSQEMDRLAKLIKLKSDIEEASFTFSMKVQARDSSQVGLLGRLFGKDATASPALERAQAVSAQEALDEMGALGVMDAEVIE
ncbi:hypothetical protein ACFVGM_08595 [Kitasatospora purpeofusca]|uniref:hypothetical protein n=1 Tax=Kitasatospora purpeofusca TaxID=67352 RepID=UPI0036D0E71B